MAGLSRATLNYLESGREIEIGATKLLTLLELLGIRWELAADLDADTDDAIVRTALAALDVEGSAGLARDVLVEALASGRVPKDSRAQFSAFLDQAPAEAILAAVRAASQHSDTAPRDVWKNARGMAKALDSERSLWHNG